ncbi:MAG TPA: hypothetical protein DF984_08065 [Anaerolineaceae bacterium]|nr:hypothetical protein [Anaerolineaceae bacterium]
MRFGLRKVYFAVILLLAACSPAAYAPEDYPEVDRLAALPADTRKVSPDTDLFPPILHSDEYEQPVPLSGAVNTSGGEDSPFIMPDGETLYIFFTPDVRLPAEEQLFDGVTGVYVTHQSGGIWGEAERVWLEPPDILSLDGAVTIQGDEMWFASVREGITGMSMFTAEWLDGRWQNWQPVSSRLRDEIQIGEARLYGDDLYFHSYRPGGQGDMDIWMTTREGDAWSDPVNIEAVNTDAMEGWPCITPDGQELWFTRQYQGTVAIFRSKWSGEDWSEPELILSQFAGEPAVDSAGNVYFAHHFFENGEMIEADIYVAYKKSK